MVEADSPETTSASSGERSSVSMEGRSSSSAESASTERSRRAKTDLIRDKAVHGNDGCGGEGPYCAVPVAWSCGASGMGGALGAAVWAVPPAHGGSEPGPSWGRGGLPPCEGGGRSIQRDAPFAGQRVSMPGQRSWDRKHALRVWEGWRRSARSRRAGERGRGCGDRTLERGGPACNRSAERHARRPFPRMTRRRHPRGPAPTTAHCELARAGGTDGTGHFPAATALLCAVPQRRPNTRRCLRRPPCSRGGCVPRWSRLFELDQRGIRCPVEEGVRVALRGCGRPL